MADNTLFGFERERDIEDLLRMLREWRQTPRPPGGPPAQPNDQPRPPILVALMSSLESGQTVRGSILKPRTALNETQVISAFGSPGGGYFRIGYSNTGGGMELTPYIYPLLDDAVVIQKYLEDLPSIGAGQISVGLGMRRETIDAEITQYDPWRWLITFGGRFEGLDMPLLKVESFLTDAYLLVQSVTVWEDTFELVDVSEVLGVPTPSPLRAGARAWCQWYPGFGYCVTAVEARDFGDYGLFA